MSTTLKKAINAALIVVGFFAVFFSFQRLFDAGYSASITGNPGGDEEGLGVAHADAPAPSSTGSDSTSCGGDSSSSSGSGSDSAGSGGGGK